jgi:hypothetical protein
MGMCTQYASVLCTLWHNLQASSVNNPRLIHYLQQDLGITDTALALVSRQQKPSATELPIVLWNHGLIDLEQLGFIFDWMESAT